MCLICVEWNNGRMTTVEAHRALKEYDDGSQEAKEHKSEMLGKLHKRLAEEVTEAQRKK